MSTVSQRTCIEAVAPQVVVDVIANVHPPLVVVHGVRAGITPHAMQLLVALVVEVPGHDCKESKPQRHIVIVTIDGGW